jgi:hypothetical protein
VFISRKRIPCDRNRREIRPCRPSDSAPPAQTDGRGVEIRRARFRAAAARGFFHHFLVAALERAVAFAKRHDAALAIAEDLHFDMARAAHVAFEEDAGIAEIALAQARHGGKAFAHGVSSSHTRMPMPPPPAVALSMIG